MLAVGANSTAIMAALPNMRIELFLSPAGVEWAVNAYLVVSAVFIVLGGQAADRFGARRSAMVGLALFGVASCIIAAAGTQAALLAGRGLQGLAAAFAVPSTLAAVNSSATPERRAAAIGAWTGFLMLGFSIGPLFGGALTHVTGWRVIFWLNVPLMLTAIAGLASAASATARDYSTQTRPADWIGFVFLSTLMVSLVFGLHALPHAGVAPLPVVGAFLLAAVALFLLLRVLCSRPRRGIALDRHDDVLLASVQVGHGNAVRRAGCGRHLPDERARLLIVGTKRRGFRVVA